MSRGCAAIGTELHPTKIDDDEMLPSFSFSKLLP